jgi:uncharacterized alpha-E superfamily protein
VLSRIAESLYWVGRHIERAEDTARILDVHFHLLLEQPAANAPVSCSNILRVMGAAPPADERVATTALVNQLLAFDETSPASIVGALSAARHNASGAREVIPSEMWQALNATYNQLPDRADTAGAVPHTFFTWVKERSALLSGLADSLMSRDDGWHFLLLGRNLERVDMTARLLTARFAPGMEATGWVTTLKCCSAHEAYLRTYRRAVDASLVAEFLLLDRLFPRSIWSALANAERCLVELSPSSGRAGLDDEARRVLGRAKNDLEYRRLGELVHDLPAFLASVQASVTAAGAAVGDRYFRSTAPVAWIA